VTVGIDQACQSLQQAMLAAGPMSELALKLANIQQMLQGLAVGMRGVPHAIGPGAPSGSMGAMPNGMNPLLRNLPNVPPMPASGPGTRVDGGMLG